jgi:tellurite resistance protein TerC
MIQAPLWLWAAFFGAVLGILGLDLLVLGNSKNKGKSSFRSALLWSAFWISLAATFALGLALWEQAGPPAAAKFASAYLLELSLSVDNLFVFLLIFSSYKVPQAQHRPVLFWGILGALALRAIFIGLGAAAVQRWHWILWIFGAFLAVTGLRLLFKEEEGQDPSKSKLLGLARRVFRVTKNYEGGKFFLWREGLFWVTPLFLVLLIIEVTDVIFALDSIPAVFGVSSDPFIVYTSNIFAILGLRSMFFALEGVMHRFRYLRYGLAAILTLIGLKMTLLEWMQASMGFQVGEGWTFGVIAAILGASVLASSLIPKKH